MRTATHRVWMLLLLPLLAAPGCKRAQTTGVPPASQSAATEPVSDAPVTEPAEPFGVGGSYVIIHGPDGKPVLVAVSPRGEVRATTLPDFVEPRITVAEAIEVAQSAIRGKHRYEWAEAVSIVRAADPSAEGLRSEFGSMLTVRPSKEGRLASRFIRDVMAKDGPAWVGAPATAGLPMTRVRQSPATPENTPAASAQALDSPRSDMHIAALVSLGKYGVLARPYIWKMAESLRSILPEERKAAVEALAHLAGTLPEAVETLGDALHDESPDARLAAIDALAASGSTDTVKYLAIALKDEKIEVRRHAAGVLAHLAVTDFLAGVVLARLVQDDDAELRKLASGAIARPDVQSAVDISTLIVALRSENPTVRRDAAYALRDRKVDGEDVMLALTVAVDKGNYIVREALADALECSRREGSSVTTVLRAAAAGANPSETAYARAALKSIEAQAAMREKP